MEKVIWIIFLVFVGLFVLAYMRYDISECVYLSDRIYILTANPCTVHSVIDIDFGDIKRNSEIRQTKTFNDYLTRIEEIMFEINKKK